MLFQKASGKKVPQVPVDSGSGDLESVLQCAWRNRLSCGKNFAQEGLMTGRRWGGGHRAANPVNFIKLVTRGDFKINLVK
jgi:hypothetical protein